MRFCFLGDIYNSYIGKRTGGAELQQALIVRNLEKAGHEIHIIDLKAKEQISLSDNIHILPLGDKKSFLIKFFFILKFSISINADIYYGRVRNSLHLILLIVSKFKKSRYIYHVAHDLDTLGYKERKKYYYRKNNFFYNIKKFFNSEIIFPFILRWSSLIFVQHEKQRYYLSLKKIKHSVVIYNLFQKPEINSNKSCNNNYYIILGSLDARKGVVNLERLIRSSKEQKFLIIGKSRDEFGGRFLSNTKTMENVKFINSVPHNEVFSYIVKSKGLISTSYLEGFSNAFIESWSMGRPVFSLYADAGGNLDKYNLGKSFNGNLDQMISFINNNNFSYDRNNLKEYVDQYHNQEKNVDLIIKNCILLYDS